LKLVAEAVFEKVLTDLERGARSYDEKLQNCLCRCIEQFNCGQYELAMYEAFEAARSFADYSQPVPPVLPAGVKELRHAFTQIQASPVLEFPTSHKPR